MLNSKDINNRIKAKDQRTLFSTVPIIVFPIPIVKILVSVEAGVVKLVGITAIFGLLSLHKAREPYQRQPQLKYQAQLPARQLYKSFANA